MVDPDPTPDPAAPTPTPAAPTSTPAEPTPGSPRAAALRFGRLALLLLTLLLAAKGIHSLVPQDDAPPALGDVPPPTVQLLKLEQEQVSHTVERFGRLLPIRQWLLTTEVPGRLQRRPVDNGGRVLKDALLVALDPVPFQAERASAAAVVSQAVASLSLATTQLARLRRLQSTTTTKDALEQAAASRDRAEASLAAAKAQLRKASYQLERCELRAPGPGVVSHLTVEAGDYVVPGQALGRLSQIDRLLVKLLVSGEVRRGVEVGQTATVIDSEEREHVATLLRAAPVPSGATGQFELELVVDNQAGALLAGEPVRCRFSHGKVRPRLRVPRASVYEEYGLWRALTPPPDAGPGAFVAQSVSVKLGSGNPEEGWVEVFSGLKPGATILVPHRVAAIREGQRVTLGGGRSGWWPPYAPPAAPGR